MPPSVKNIRFIKMKLTNENIAKTVEDVENFFRKAKVSNRDVMKIILLIEGALVLWQEHFGANTEFKFNKRSWFGTYKVTIKVKDKPFKSVANRKLRRRNDFQQRYNAKSPAPRRRADDLSLRERLQRNNCFVRKRTQAD